MNLPELVKLTLEAESLDVGNSHACVAFSLRLAQGTQKFGPQAIDAVIRQLPESLFRDFWIGTLIHPRAAEHAARLIEHAEYLFEDGHLDDRELAALKTLREIVKSMSITAAKNFKAEGNFWRIFN